MHDQTTFQNRFSVYLIQAWALLWVHQTLLPKENKPVSEIETSGFTTSQIQSNLVCLIHVNWYACRDNSYAIALYTISHNPSHSSIPTICYSHAWDISILHGTRPSTGSMISHSEACFHRVWNLSMHIVFNAQGTTQMEDAILWHIDDYISQSASYVAPRWILYGVNYPFLFFLTYGPLVFQEYDDPIVVSGSCQPQTLVLLPIKAKPERVFRD